MIETLRAKIRENFGKSNRPKEGRGGAGATVARPSTLLDQQLLLRGIEILSSSF